jgi:dTDP-glucose pyrophosphorylase
LAQAFVLGAEFIGDDSVCLVLGDNIFYGHKFPELLRESANPNGGIVFAYQVKDPERYGVVEFDQNFNALSIEEKPQNRIMLYLAFIFMITASSKLQKTFNPVQEENMRSLMSTENI